VREMKWSPVEIGDLFIDDQDYQGLEYWYQDIVKMNSELTKKE
jgi:hypothetical protein